MNRKPTQLVPFALLPAILLPVAACREQTDRTTHLSSQVQGNLKVRDIRVLILENVDQFSLRIDGPFVVRNPAAGKLADGQTLPWSTVSRATGDFTVGDWRWTAGTLEIVPLQGTRVLLWRLDGGKWVGPLAYAGYVRCTRRTASTMNIINVVDLDTYVTGVVASEIYADFHGEAFRAQAVASRTYALWQMARNTTSAFDVRATEASQVYGGIPTGPGAAKARDAADHTRGIVCTWPSPRGERLFCTYYSSACGGLTQSVSNALQSRDITPLSGSVRCNYCSIAQKRGNAYRWGPASVNKADLSRNLAEHDPSFRTIGAVDRVEVGSRTPSGRLASIRVIGTTGTQRTLKAEEFRLAAGPRVMRSTDCQVEDVGRTVQFSDGRGFGHGVGMCQWGMEGQAALGRRADQILKFYYPGMNLTRAY